MAMPLLAAAALAWLALAGQSAVSGDLRASVVYAPAAGVNQKQIEADLHGIRRAGYNTVVPRDAAVARRIGAAARAAELFVADVPVKNAPQRITVGSGVRAATEARLAFWTTIAGGAKEVAFAAPSGRVTPEIRALGETAGIVTRNQSLFVPLRPRREGVRDVSTGLLGPVQVRLLESADTLMIVAISRLAAPRKVSISFALDIPEAIWQNLETGTTVSFVMGNDGPVLEHTFAPRDSLVLMIRKRYR